MHSVNIAMRYSGKKLDFCVVVNRVWDLQVRPCPPFCFIYESGEPERSESTWQAQYSAPWRWGSPKVAR